MQIPRLEIVVNMGVGEAVNDRKKVDTAASDLALIAGQKPIITRARKAIATYKLREGMAIGAKVTLRGDRMYEFLDRFITIALPRVRDFRGLNPKSAVVEAVPAVVKKTWPTSLRRAARRSPSSST